MSIKYTARQKALGLTECERICGRSWSELERLAHKSGWYGIPGGQVSVSPGTVLNILVLLIAANHGIELEAMAAWLPGLRNEALLELGARISNWSFVGSNDAEHQFWPTFYGDRKTVQTRIAPLLDCCANVTTQELRFYSPSNVERISSTDFDRPQSTQTPRFTVNAHDLADKVQGGANGCLFIAKTAD